MHRVVRVVKNKVVCILVRFFCGPPQSFAIRKLETVKNPQNRDLHNPHTTNSPPIGPQAALSPSPSTPSPIGQSSSKRRSRRPSPRTRRRRTHCSRATELPAAPPAAERLRTASTQAQELPQVSRISLRPLWMRTTRTTGLGAVPAPAPCFSRRRV